MTAEPLTVEVDRAEEIAREIYAATGNLGLLLSARHRRHYHRSSFRWTR